MIGTCPTWPTLLAWTENDLPDEESQLLNTHVADCEECRERLALMNAVQSVVYELPFNFLKGGRDRCFGEDHLRPQPVSQCFQKVSDPR